MFVTDTFFVLSAVWHAGLLMLGLGTGFAIVLLIASIKLKVRIDPKIEQVHEVLPNIDCGACGFAGCASYAKAVVKDPKLLGKCAPGGPAVSNKIANILNLQMSGGGKPQRPVVHCRSHTEDKEFYATYSGIPSCTAANAQPSVQQCTFGCLGYGDCVDACKFDALDIVDGLAVVNYQNCTGCGACVQACPRELIEMIPFGHENMMVVACRSIENGKTTRQMCSVGCIGCSLCEKQSDLFKIQNNLAAVDFERYEPSEQTQTAITKCPTGVIVLRGKNAPADKPPKQKPVTKA